MFGKPFSTKLFDPKTEFLDSKTQTICSFFEIFEIDLQFWLISELFPNLNFQTFFQTFSRKF